MLPLILNASQYHSYARLKSISNEFRQPVVIRNLFKSSNAMNWNLSYLNTTIGREECNVLLPHSQYFESDRESKLYSHILRNISNHGWNYVSGDQNILFNASNDLIYDLNLRQILGDEYLHSPDFLPDELYFFVGNAYGGTAWHSAPNRSLFVLLKGLKRWIFIDPKYAVYLKPQRSQLYSRILLLFGRFIQHTKHINHFEDSHSLYRHIPHYEVVLRPGDAITVPSWWWHHVTNLDDETEDDGLNIGIDIDTKQWNYDFLRSIFPRFV